MIEDKTKLNLLNTMMKIGGDDQNNNTDSSQPQLPSTRQSVGGIDDQNGATTNAEDDQGGLSGQSNAEKKKKRRSFSHVIQQTTMKPIMNISKGISSLQFKSRDVELRMNELLVYTVKDSHKNRKLKADLHLTHASITMDPLYKNCIKIETKEKILRVIIEDEGRWNDFRIHQSNQSNETRQYFDPNSNLLAEPPTGRKRRLKFPSFEISGTTNDVLDSIQPSPSTGTTTAVDYSPLHSTQMKMEPIVKEHLSLLSTEFTNIQNFTFASAIAHLTMIGHTVMEKAQIEASTQSIINMTGGSTILKQGYLIKAGPNDHQPWKKRYCVLTEAREFRYLEDIGGAPKGLFSVENAWASRINDESIHIIPFATTQQALFTMGSSFASRRFLFKIETVDRVYKFEAPSYVSMKSWFQALELCGCHVKADENDGIILSGKLLKERMTTTTTTTTTTTSTSSGNANKDESSHSSQWISRHVVLLESNELKYYNKKGGTLLGTIKLEESYINRVTSGSSSGSGSATQAESSPNTSYHYRFKIYTPERTHQFETKDEETLQKWINTIVQYSAHSGGGEGCKLRNENDPEPIFKKKLNHFYLKSTEQVILEKQEKLQDYIVSEEKLKSKLMRNKSQASSSAKLNSSMRKAHNESLTLSEEGHRVEGSSSPMSEPPNSSKFISKDSQQSRSVEENCEE
ncbi:hypothetical protein C9374_001992 [Naegleria lovaniensis]|uniref:PH domain-containing protein n=1 Tax=Naegleria lovaniensis TaxID=51637 RepID=A0AA88GTW6_NAELO|nr:uncharacterized protein C9374_001992 [Naegleria lovaniensis]KAG2386957.1 hypothetical protein C9374_001992 [Naegleria lovaniensis]